MKRWQVVMAVMLVCVGCGQPAQESAGGPLGHVQVVTFDMDAPRMQASIEHVRSNSGRPFEQVVIHNTRHGFVTVRAGQGDLSMVQAFGAEVEPEGFRIYFYLDPDQRVSQRIDSALVRCPIELQNPVVY